MAEVTEGGSSEMVCRCEHFLYHTINTLKLIHIQNDGNNSITIDSKQRNRHLFLSFPQKGQVAELIINIRVDTSITKMRQINYISS